MNHDKRLQLLDHLQRACGQMTCVRDVAREEKLTDVHKRALEMCENIASLIREVRRG